MKTGFYVHNSLCNGVALAVVLIATVISTGLLASNLWPAQDEDLVVPFADPIQVTPVPPQKPVPALRADVQTSDGRRWMIAVNGTLDIVEIKSERPPIEVPEMFASKVPSNWTNEDGTPIPWEDVLARLNAIRAIPVTASAASSPEILDSPGEIEASEATEPKKD